MGTAHLLGQLKLEASVHNGLQFLRHAVDLVTCEYSRPAFVWGSVLLGRFPNQPVSEAILQSYLPAGTTAQQEGKKYLEQAALCNYGPALHQIAEFYEYSAPLYERNPVFSLSYYGRASRSGIAEAYMGMSRWFLCGADGLDGFPKDRAKARECANRAASAKLPVAEFAMGYYNEAGVGGPVNIESARQWYTLVRCTFRSVASVH